VKFLLSLLLFAVAAGAQTAPPASRKPATPTGAGSSAPANPATSLVAPDEGTLEGRLYTSDYFGFRYSVPEEFEVSDDPAEGEEDASHRSFVLLAAHGAGERQGDVLLVLADQAAASGATQPDTYLAKVTTDLLKRQGFAPQGAVRPLTLAGRGFARADFTREAAAQTVLVTMLRGYAVNFVLMAPSREAVDRMLASLDTLKFTPRRSVPKPPAGAPSVPSH
jgi:hypothetical protein